MSKRPFFAFLLPFALSLTSAAGQSLNASQQVILQGLRSQSALGSFKSAAYAPDGSLYLLLDQHDGIRLLKTDANATYLLAQSNSGSAGDSGVAMALDSAGNVYVTGTTTSGSLAGTTGAAFPHSADSSTNSFLAKYDANLNLIFLTFLGSGRTSVSALGVSSAGVVVTGITFNAAFPVTAAGIQQQPASGATENGFVESFTTDGATLQYATYLTGANGNTIPAAIATDSAGNAYIAGATSSVAFPTIAALQPTMLLAAGSSNSGFLSRLNSAGSAFIFSTYIAGAGITGLALDAQTNSILLSGNVSPGQFPIATAAMPLASTAYQTLLRIPQDGQSVTESVLLTAGSSSYVAAGYNGDAWISGAITTPLFPGITQPGYDAGDSFLMHVASSGIIDQTLRFGGIAQNNASYASLTSNVDAPAVSGSTVTLPGTITATLSASSLATQSFELPLAATPNAVLPSTLQNIIPTAAACGSATCTGSGAFLAQVSTVNAAPSLAVSIDDAADLTVRNLGSATANGLTITATGFTTASDCGTSLAPSNLCSIALTGSGPGILALSANNTTTRTIALPAASIPANSLAINTDEIDFGIVSSVSEVVSRSIVITNLSSQTQTFASVRDGASGAYTLGEVASTCAAGAVAAAHTLAAGASCNITLGLSASTASANDGAFRTAWKIGTRDITITGFAQAAALSISAAEVDFGTFIAGGRELPRYLYLSNNASVSVAHAAAVLPASSPFTVTDNCPLTLQPQSVCSLLITYQPATATSADTQTLLLDNGISVLLTGEALPTQTVTASSVNPNLNVSTTALTFGSSVPVTGISATTLPVILTNTGTSAFALGTVIAGDFSSVGNCGAMLGAGATCTLLVSFAPSQPGLRQGLLSIAAGSGFAPQYVALNGTATAILPANNGLLNLGQTFAGEPLVAWYKLQQSLPSLTATVSDRAFGVALVPDTGSGHGSLPPQSFASTATLACSSCWLGVQYLSSVAQTSSANVTLSTVTGGNPYVLSVTATALPVQGLVLTPSTQDFGPTAIGSSSAALTFSLANLLASSSAVTVQSVTVNGDFALTTNNSGGPACAGQLAATAACFLQLTFTPTATGERSGVLTITTSGGTVTAALAGYGLASTGLSISPDEVIFAEAAATSQTVTLTNSSATPLIIGSSTVSGSGFTASTTCSTLAPGTVCSIIVTFMPQSALVNATLSIPVTTTINGQPLSTTYTVPLTGAYTTQDAGLLILPAEANYGATPTGSIGLTREYGLSNLSGKPLNIALSMARQFPLSASPACTTLAAGASCTFSVSFAPLTTGEQTGTILAEGSSTDGLINTQALGYLQGYGSGAGSLTITGGTIPYSPLMFGQVSSGQTATQTLTLTNTGTAALTIRRISSAPPFLSTTTCGAMLAAAANCTVTVTYAPIYELAAGSAAGGTRNDLGSLSIESDAITSPDFVTMTGLVLPITSASPQSSALLATYTLSNGALTFGNTQVGNASAAQTVTLTNNGTTVLHVLGVNIAPDFSQTSNCATLLPGDVCTLSITFAPTSASSAALRSGALELRTDATNSLDFMSLLGSTSASPLVFSQESLNFGAVNVGFSQSLSVSVTNTSAAPATFTGLSASGAFSVTQGTCPSVGSTLAAGSSCTLVATFAPIATGAQTSTLSLASDATQFPLTLPLSGTGVAAQLQVSPGALNFGSIAVAASASLTLTLINKGTAVMTGVANSISGVNAADFAVTAPCGPTLLPNASCMETITFTPAVAGSRAATLSIASSDPSGPTTIALTGSGAAAGTYTLTVNGSSTSTMTVAAGSAAIFPLLVTPMNGYTGSVALTCTSINPGKYASCSLLSPLLTLSASAAGTTATISTISSALQQGAGALAVLLLLSPLTLRRRRRGLILCSIATISLAFCLSLTACGSGSSSGSSGGSKTVVTPSGTYQYQVTASSINGTAISSSVTLNLIVQ